MSALVFLGIAVAVSVLGCMALWLRSRQPRSMDARIREFAKELEALAPDSDETASRHPRRRGSDRERAPGGREGRRSG